MEEKRFSEFEEAARSVRPQGLLSQGWAFVWQTKKWWMMPIIITLALVGILVFLSSSAAAPFIYTLF